MQVTCTSTPVRVHRPKHVLHVVAGDGDGRVGVAADEKLVIVGGRLVDDIVARWPLWKHDVPD